MDQAHLHQLRILVPGVLIVLLAISLVTPDPGFIKAVNGADVGGLGLAGISVIATGALYLILDARTRLTSFSWIGIRRNIEDRLLALLRTRRPVSAEEEQHLRGQRRLLEAFYRLLDGDESLKVKQHSVRLNGLLVTSVADVSALSLVGLAIHGALAPIRGGWSDALWVGGLGLLRLVSERFLLPRTLGRHRTISDEQLDFIATYYPDQLREYAGLALRSMSHSDAPEGGAGHPGH
jgi:hypothetical protein